MKGKESDLGSNAHFQSAILFAGTSVYLIALQALCVFLIGLQGTIRLFNRLLGD
jgi:hypothetical protein